VRSEQHGRALGLVVGKSVMVGTSGGGIFRAATGQLHHIGNIWRTWDTASLAALNHAMVLR